VQGHGDAPDRASPGLSRTLDRTCTAQIERIGLGRAGSEISREVGWCSRNGIDRIVGQTLPLHFRIHPATLFCLQKSGLLTCFLIIIQKTFTTAIPPWLHPIPYNSTIRIMDRF
jgi:hypothetical protein